MKQLFRKASLALVVMLQIILVCGCSHTEATPAAIQPSRIAIIDAGSSGTRLYVFGVDQSQEAITQIYPPTADVDPFATPPLSATPFDKEHLGPLIESLTEHCPSTGCTTPMYVLSTAGMRLIEEHQAQKAYDILASLGEVNGYKIAQAMTISECSEGVYALIAANYGQPLPLEGIIEMGGGSMQIAFPTTSSSEYTLNHPRLGSIYSRSYLGGGSNQAYAHYTAETIGQYTATIDDVSDDYPEGIAFKARGKRLCNFLAAATFDNVPHYVAQLQSQGVKDTPTHHPIFDAWYFKSLAERLRLTHRLSLTHGDTSWTLGAAVDIALYGQKPQPYTYR